MANSDDYFPEEVITRILSWTKLTSLLRFKSVCKLWRSIISQPKFMQAHHPNSLKSPSLLIITSGVDNHRAATIFYPHDEAYVSLRLPLLFHTMKFVSSCNGLLCVCDALGDDIYLFNPLTRMSKKLLHVVDSRQDKPFKVDVVFGFDCVSRDFKVLRIKYRKNDNGNQLVTAFLVELYSSNADSWREIGVSFKLPSFVYFPLCPVLISGPVLDGVLYLEGENEIVTFDLRNEVFGLIPFPDFMKRRKSNLLDFDGSVALVIESVTEFDGLVCKETSLWTMDTVSDEVFWSQKFIFEAGLELNWVFLHLGAKQFFVTTRLGEMWYDHSKKETKCIQLPSQSFLTKVVKHAESFISIQGFQQVEEN